MVVEVVHGTEVDEGLLRPIFAFSCISIRYQKIFRIHKREKQNAKNKFQDVIYTIIMASAIGYAALVAYNIIAEHRFQCRTGYSLAVFHE